MSLLSCDLDTSIQVPGWIVLMNYFDTPTSFPGSLIFPPKRERRDPGWVWSRATLTIENIREGSSCNQAICRFELCRIQSEADSIALCPPLPAMFYSSLQAAISNSIYSNVNLKVKQVICLEAIYHGRDVVAVLPTGYTASAAASNSSFDFLKRFLQYLKSLIEPHNLQQLWFPLSDDG